MLHVLVMRSDYIYRERERERERERGTGISYSVMLTGTLQCIVELEKKVAQFVGKPAALVFGMGFSTNSTNIPALVDKVMCL